MTPSCRIVSFQNDFNKAFSYYKAAADLVSPAENPLPHYGEHCLCSRITEALLDYREL